MGDKLTLFKINFMAMTNMQEIKITFEQEGKLGFSLKGKRKKFWLEPNIDSDTLVFKGWNLPIVSDREKGTCMRGNATLNIMARSQETKEEVIKFIEENQLNIGVEEAIKRINFIPGDNTNTDNDEKLFSN